MASRLNLQTMLENLLGSENVYFQPPASVSMKYPAIVYELSEIKNTHADGSVYKQEIAYALTVICKDPDNEIVKNVSRLPKCRFDRHFRSDNLNHYTFTLYY